jgi:hypothetical protein
MTIKQTQLFDPPARSNAVDNKGYIATPFRQWLFSVQNLHPLVAVNTAAASVVIALPPAGVQAAGQSNQNMEITYRKTSLDGNTLTITGSADGTVILTLGDGSAGSLAKFKSDGTSWWRTG